MPKANRRAPQLDSLLCFSLYSTMLGINKVYRQLLRDLDLTYSQYLVMLVLWEKDGQNVSEICQRLFLETTTLTPLLKRLEALGFVARIRDVHGERRVHITLTAEGRRLKARALKVPGCIRDAAQCSMSELVQLKRQLHGLRERLAAA